MMVRASVHIETDICQSQTDRSDGDLCALAACSHQVVWQTSLGLKGQHFFHCNIHASTTMCPVKVSLSETVSRWGWGGKERKRGRETVTQETKQTQISFALLRRQGAEHRVLVDATKPFKTTLQPWTCTPPPPSHLSSNWHTPFTFTSARGDPTGRAFSLKGRSWSVHLDFICGLIALNQLLFIMIKWNDGFDFKAVFASSNASFACE